MRTRVFVLAALLVALLGCHGLPREDLERALELEDTRVVDAAAWTPLLGHGDARVRAAAARGLGRVRAPELAPLLIERLEVETRVAVREECVFALGQLGGVANAESTRVLQTILERGDGLERALAAEALGKLGDQFAMPLLVEALEAEDPALRGASLLAITRLRGRRAKVDEPLPKSIEQRLRAAIVARVGDEDPEVRWRAVYALSELLLPGGEVGLEAGLESEDPRMQLFALRGLGRVEELGVDVLEDRIVALRDGDDPHVAATAAALVPMVVGEDASWHVRAAALSALSTRAPAPEFADFVESALADSSPSVRRAALEAAPAQLPAERALREIRAAALGNDPWMRGAAARAAARLGGEEARTLLVEMVRARDGLSTPPALDALAAEPLGRETARIEALRLLTSEDVALLYSALSALGEVGAPEDVPLIGDTFRRAEGEEFVEARVEALRTLIALDAQAAAPLFALATKDPFAAVRLVAREGMEAAGGELEDFEVASLRPSDVSLLIGDDVFSSAPNPRVALATEKGRIVIELLREDAPRHVKSFLQRTRAGLYDGNLFHRVVTGFVVQGLDPRGDGWGTGEVFVRDEINREPFLRGAVGMPNAGPDTAGCQIFVNHVPTPHLNGGYTVFGRVVEGMAVVDALDLGDVVERVTIVD